MLMLFCSSLVLGNFLWTEVPLVDQQRAQNNISDWDVVEFVYNPMFLEKEDPFSAASLRPPEYEVLPPQRLLQLK
jgi:hypothetical protein